MTDFEKYLKMVEEANKIKVKVGDKVRAMGITSTIAMIYYCDVYVETGHPMFREAKDEDEYYIFYDIEFRDTDGVLRHWKSSYDGGKLIQN